MNPVEMLKAVLCDPDGKCCIAGSDADRAIVDAALAAIAQPVQPAFDNSGPPYTLDGMDPILRGLIVCAVHGAITRKTPPPEGHWLASSWELGQAARLTSEQAAAALTLGEALPQEMARVRDEVLPAYMEIVTGIFAASMMRADLDRAAKALAEGDVAEMIQVYRSLKEYHL